MTADRRLRDIRVERVMGTIVTLDVREPFVDPAALDAAIAWFHDVDRRFSPFRPDSEVSRIADGQLALDDASPDVRAMFTLADAIRERSGGAFDAQRHRLDGRPDPTGVVKGWSVDEAAIGLRLAGARNFQVVAGGDLVAAGEPAPGMPWRIGIRHPDRPDAVAGVLHVRDLAVATSGRYERGDHVVDARTGAAATALRSLTVVGPALALADAYATAGFALGEAGAAWIAGQPGYGAVAITTAGRVIWTADVDPLLRLDSTVA